MHRARRAQASLPVRLRRAATCRVKLEGDDWSDPPPLFGRVPWRTRSQPMAYYSTVGILPSSHLRQIWRRARSAKITSKFIFTAPVKPYSSRKLHQLRTPMIRCWCGRERTRRDDLGLQEEARIVGPRPLAALTPRSADCKSMHSTASARRSSTRASSHEVTRVRVRRGRG